MKDADIVLVSPLSILLLNFSLFLSETIYGRWYGRHPIRRLPRFLRDCTLLSDDTFRFSATRILASHICSVLLLEDYGVGLYVDGACRVHVL